MQAMGDKDPVANQFADLWEFWLGEKSTLEFREKSFYESEHIHPDKEAHPCGGTRIIAMNTQACNNMNFYLLDDPRDPGGMLEWLEDKLRTMEEKGEVAVIIGHIAPSHYECLYEWSKRYNILMERF